MTLEIENKKEQPEYEYSDYSLDILAKKYLKELLTIENNSPEYISAITELYKAIYRI